MHILSGDLKGEVRTMSIICGTSFSARSEAAVRAAAGIAARLRKTLVLAHVVRPEASRLLGDNVKRAAKDVLEGIAAPLRSDGAEVACVVEEGEPGERLLSLAREHDGSLLVLAAAAVKDEHFGVVDTVLRKTVVPALTVREGGALERWCRTGEPLKVMLGVDRSAATQAARAWLRKLAEVGPLQVTAGHVYWPVSEYQRLGMAPPLAFNELDPELEHLLSAEVAGLAGPGPDGRPAGVALRMGIGRTADHLVALAEQVRADLLVVGSHHRRGLGRLWAVSEISARLAGMSVACVPMNALPRGVEVELPELMDVIAATDFSAGGDRAVAYACRLVTTGGTVHLVHVRPAPPAPAEEAELRRKLGERIPRQAEQIGIRFELHVCSGERADAIAQLAERIHADAICTGSRTHGRVVSAVVGSVARALLEKTARPVLLA